MAGGFDIAQLPAQGQDQTFTGGQPQQVSPSIQILQQQDESYANSLQQQFANESQALEQQFMSDEQFTNRSATLKAKYQDAWLKRKFASEQSAQSINRINTMVAQGKMDARLGEEATFKMVMEPEAYAAKYPKQGTRQRPMSSSGVRSSSALMGEFMSGFEEKRGFEWGAPKMTTESMLNQYADWRQQVGYDQLDPTHQRQLDQRWDSLMRSDKQTSSWFGDNKEPIAEVRAMRARGRIGKEMSKRLVPPSSRAVSTPIGTAVRKTMFKSQPAQKAAPTKEQLEASPSPENYAQGQKLGYWK
jgi:hypothetical protein